jgi:hypothetical protein
MHKLRHRIQSFPHILLRTDTALVPLIVHDDLSIRSETISSAILLCEYLGMIPRDYPEVTFVEFPRFAWWSLGILLVHLWLDLLLLALLLQLLGLLLLELLQPLAFSSWCLLGHHWIWLMGCELVGLLLGKYFLMFLLFFVFLLKNKWDWGIVVDLHLLVRLLLL